MVKSRPKRLIMSDEKQARRLHKRQTQENEHQQHLLGIYFPEFKAGEYEDRESDYYKKFHNLFIKNKYNHYMIIIKKSIIINLYILHTMIININ
jgi:hypothetical protein